MLFMVFVCANVFVLSVSNAGDPARSRSSHGWPGVVLPNYLLPDYQVKEAPGCFGNNRGENSGEYGIGFNCMQVRLMGAPSVPNSLSVSLPLIWSEQSGKLSLEFGVILDDQLLQSGLAVDGMATTAVGNGPNAEYQGLNSGLNSLSGFNYVSVHQVVNNTDLQLGFGTDYRQVRPDNVLFVTLSNRW